MSDESNESMVTGAAPSGSTPTQPAAGKRRPRRIVTGVAVAVTIVLFLAAATALWAKRTVLSTDRVVSAVDQALADPTVIDALSTRITDEIVSLIDVTAIVQDVLPSQLDSLGPIIEAQVTNLVKDQVTKVVSSDAGQQLINASVRRAHAAAIKLLEGGGLSPDSAFSVQDGEVVLDVVPLIVQTVELMQERGIISDRFDLTQIAENVASNTKVQMLAGIFGVSVPENFGQITILDSARVTEVSETLSTAQRALAIFQKATVILVVLALVMIAVSMALSLDRRRTLAQLSIGIGVGAILMRIGIDRVVAAIDHAIEKAGPRAAAVQMTESLTEMLARTLVTLAIVGLMVGLIAYLLKPASDGGDSWLTGIVRDRGDIARVVVVGVCIALLAAVGLSWITFILVAALGAAGVVYINRRSATPAADEPLG